MEMIKKLDFPRDITTFQTGWSLTPCEYLTTPFTNFCLVYDANVCHWKCHFKWIMSYDCLVHKQNQHSNYETTWIKSVWLCFIRVFNGKHHQNESQCDEWPTSNVKTIILSKIQCSDRSNLMGRRFAILSIEREPFIWLMLIFHHLMEIRPFEKKRTHIHFLRNERKRKRNIERKFAYQSVACKCIAYSSCRIEADEEIQSTFKCTGLEVHSIYTYLKIWQALNEKLQTHSTHRERKKWWKSAATSLHWTQTNSRGILCD